MFISKHEYRRIIERIEALETQNRQLQRRTGVYVGDDGELYGWEGSCPSVVDAVNALAKHIGFKWKQVHARSAGLEADPESKKCK
jgi:hypothetical protein